MQVNGLQKGSLQEKHAVYDADPMQSMSPVFEREEVRQKAEEVMSKNELLIKINQNTNFQLAAN